MNKAESRIWNLESRTKFLLITMSIISLAAACNQTNLPQPKTEPLVYKSGTVLIGNKTVHVQVADTDVLRTQGLSGRVSLGANEGMMFRFPAPDQYGFWMKDMQFPLDFIWIRAGVVSQITPNVPAQPNAADKDLTMYLPALPVDSVLEVNAGWANSSGIKVGDAVVDQF